MLITLCRHWPHMSKGTTSIPVVSAAAIIFAVVAASAGADVPAPSVVAERAAEVAARIDDAFEGEVVARMTVYHDEGDDYIEQNRYVRKGDAVNIERTIVQSDNPGIPEGERWVIGGSPERRYRIAAQDDGEDYEIRAYGEPDPEDFADSTTSLALPLYAPFQLRTERLAASLQPGVDKTFESAEYVADWVGRDAVRLVMRRHFPADPAEGFDEPEDFIFHFYFHPKSWVSLGFSSQPADPEPGGRASATEIFYENPLAFPPRIARVVRSSTPLDSGERRVVVSYDVESVVFRDVEDSEFTLAAFGVEEPESFTLATGETVSTGGGKTWPWIFGVGLAVLGIILAVVGARRRSAANAA